MAAKVTYTKKGSDPSSIVWPPHGAPGEQYTFTDGVAVSFPNLIGYGDGSVTFSDGRPFPPLTGQGSTFQHGK